MKKVLVGTMIVMAFITGCSEDEPKLNACEKAAVDYEKALSTYEAASAAYSNASGATTTEIYRLQDLMRKAEGELNLALKTKSSACN